MYKTRNVPDSLGDRKVKPGRLTTVYSDELEIVVWDDEYEDGDIISLNFNGEWILKEFTLKSRKTKINIRLEKNADNYLVLYAHNEGTRPPNTAALMVRDGKYNRKMALSSDMKSCGAINFRLKE